MSNLKVGVVGVGHIGREHARIYSQLPGVEFVGLYDLDSQVAQKVAQRHGVKAFSSASALAEAVDAATIATPTSSHHEIGSLLLGMGKHVLIEKPITDNTEQAKSCCRWATSSGSTRP